MEAATAGYKWLVDLYDRENAIDDPEVLNYIGLGAAQYARWKRQSDQFNVLVNDFYPELLKLEPNFWQAHYETGRLYAEKFNEADAASEFNAALALNPNAAEVHAAIASLAIENYDLAAAQSSLGARWRSIRRCCGRISSRPTWIWRISNQPAHRPLAVGSEAGPDE